MSFCQPDAIYLQMYTSFRFRLSNRLALRTTPLSSPSGREFLISHKPPILRFNSEISYRSTLRTRVPEARRRFVACSEFRPCNQVTDYHVATLPSQLQVRQSRTSLLSKCRLMYSHMFVRNEMSCEGEIYTASTLRNKAVSIPHRRPHPDFDLSYCLQLRNYDAFSCSKAKPI